MQFRNPLASDVSLEMAIRAHAGTSHSPERRAKVKWPTMWRT
jgi:hypothetical protein